VVVIALLGLAVGSFLNVVIHRVPRSESVVSPGSHCPACGRPVRARHDIPALDWLPLRGRCADCGTRISVCYPLVELLTGGLFVGVAARFDGPDLHVRRPRARTRSCSRPWTPEHREWSEPDQNSEGLTGKWRLA
jgi:prepilin signal peptidase PulO-like enzyme (type II secretory pathway)